MKGIVFIDSDEIGSADFKVIDASMGGIQGQLYPTDNYRKYRKLVQNLFDEKGIANIEDFNFRIVLEDKTKLQPDGGVGITDSYAFDEIFVEVAGLNKRLIQRISGKNPYDVEQNLQVTTPSASPGFRTVVRKSG